MELSDRRALGGRIGELRPGETPGLEPLLTEQAELIWRTLHWRDSPWDKAWPGFTWIQDGEVQGFLTLRVSGEVVLLGRVFASRRGPTEAVEAALLGAAIARAFNSPGIRRFSGEVFGATAATSAWLSGSWPGQVRPRSLMEVAWRGAAQDGPGAALEPWRPVHLAAAASLLRRSYAHVPEFLADPAWDSEDGFARLLEHTMTHPVVGVYEPGASFMALDPASGALLGLILATRMDVDQGHVAEVAVEPAARGRGLGRALLVACLDALHARGCRATHLTVHQHNTPAVRLYRSLGFVDRHPYPELRLLIAGTSAPRDDRDP